MIFLNISGDFSYNENLVNVTYLITQTLGTFLNFLTLFVIWKYSTPDMKDYKIHLLLYQFGSGSLDFGVDILATPVFFFPYIAGTSQGILHKIFGMDSFLVAIILFTYVCFIIHYIVVNPLLYRWQVILPDTALLKIHDPKKMFFFKHLAMIIATVPLPFLFYPSWDDNETNKASFRETYPQDANLADVEGFVWVNTKKHPSFFYALGWLAFWLMYTVVLVNLCNIGIIGTLESLKSHMSATTREMHKKFLRFIRLQTMVPMLWLVIPTGYWLIIMFGDIRYPRHQEITNISVAFASSHGAVGSLVLLCFNSCYRQGVYSIFIRPFKKVTPVTSIALPSSQMNVTVV